MASIGLKVQKFEELLIQRGAESNVAAAALLELNDGTISRIRAGKANPGEKFVANSLTIFAVRFDELFNIEADDHTTAAVDISAPEKIEAAAA